METIVLKLQSVPRFAKQMKLIAPEELMRKVVRSPIHVFHRRETTMEIYVLFTALPCVMETRYFARDQEANQVAKNPTHVIILTLRLKVMILVVYALAIVLKIVRPMKF